MKNLIGTLLLVFLLSADASAFGFGKKGRSDELGRGGKMGKLLKQLDLSKEQKEKIKEHRESNKGNKKELRSQLKEAKSKMQTAFQSNASEGELRSLHSELKSLKTRMADARFEKMLFLRSVLTPEQRAKLEELKSQRKGKRGQRAGMRGKRNFRESMAQ
jgi:Spy/CpxP family protein refolding chaperone